MKYYKIIENINFILVLAIVSGSAIFISQHTNPAIEIKLYYAGILNAILTILSLIQIMLNDKLKKQNVFAPLIFGIILYFSATFFWSVAKPLSLRYLFIFITFALIYFNFSLQINSELKIKILLTFISLICTAVCLFGLLQFFGFDFYKWGRVYELFESPDILRVISSFGNPNFFGVYIIAVFPIILALNHLRFENNIYILANISLFLLFCASYFKIDFFYHDTDLTKINVEYLLSAIFIISLLIIFIIHRLLQIQTIKQFITNYLLPFINILFIAIITISLSLTYNRCAYLAFAAEIMLFYLLLKFYLKRKIISKIGIIYLCAVMIILIIIIFNSQTLKKPIISSWQRFVNITNTSQSDIKIRFDLWQVVLNTVRNQPILGNGIGTFVSIFPSEITLNWKKIFPKPEYIVESAHSEYLEILAETGILGLALIFILIIYIFFISVKLLKNLADKSEFYAVLIIAIISAFIGILIHAFFESKIRYISSITPLICYLAILEYIHYKITEHQQIQSRQNKYKNQFTKKIILIIITFISLLNILFYFKPLFSNVYGNYALIELPYTQNDYTNILSLIDKSLENDKHNEIILYLKSRISAQQQNIPVFNQTITNLLYFSPYFKDINNIIADVYNRADDFNAARYFLKKEAKVSKSQDAAILLEFSKYMRGADYKTAEKILIDNYEKLENQAYADFLLGKIATLMQNNQQAIKYYKNSILKSNQTAVNYFNLAFAYFKTNNFNYALYYLYLAKLLDLKNNTISPVKWTEIINRIDNRIFAAADISEYAKFLYFKLKLFCGLINNIDNDIAVLKNQLTSKFIIDELLEITNNVRPVQNPKPSKIVNDIKFNSFGAVGYDLATTDFFADNEYSLILYFGTAQKIPLKFQGYIQLTNANQSFKISESLYIDLTKFLNNEIKTFNIKLRIPRELQNDDYNLDFVYNINDNNLEFSRIFSEITNNYSTNITKVKIKSADNLKNEILAEKYYNQADYQKAYDIAFNQLAPSYKVTDLRFQFFKLKLLTILNKKNEALEYLNKCRELYNKYGYNNITDKYGHTLIYEIMPEYLDYLKFYLDNDLSNIKDEDIIRITEPIKFYPKKLINAYYQQKNKNIQFSKIGEYETPFKFYFSNDNISLSEQKQFISKILNILISELTQNNNPDFDALFINRSYFQILDKNIVMDFIDKLLKTKKQLPLNFQTIIGDYADSLINKIWRFLIENQEYNTALFFLDEMTILQNYPKSKLMFYKFYTYLKMKDYDKSTKLLKDWQILRKNNDEYNDYYYYAKFINEKIRETAKFRVLEKLFDFSDNSQSSKSFENFIILNDECYIDNDDFLVIALTLKSDNFTGLTTISIGYINAIDEFIELDKLPNISNLMPDEVITFTKKIPLTKHLKKYLLDSQTKIAINTLASDAYKITIPLLLNISQRGR